MATTSTDGNDTFVGLHTTMTALDTLDGGAGTDTLLYIDDSAAGTPLAVQFSNMETVAVRNLSGNAATTASAETATVSFQALAAGQTVVIAGVTFTAGSSGATAAEVAAAFTTGTVTDGGSTATVSGGVLSGTAIDTAAGVSSNTTAAMATARAADLATGGYTAAAGGQVNSAKFTSNATTPTNVTDLAVTGTAVTGRDAVQTITVATKSAGTAALTFTINGTTVTTAVPTANTDAADAVAIAAAINGFVGQTVASAALAVVTVTTPSGLNFGSFTDPDGSPTLAVTTALQTGSLSVAAPTITIVDGVAAVAGSTNAMTVDASAWTGVTTIMNTASTDAVTFSGMTEIATLAVEKVIAGALATTTANFDADLTNGTADAVSVSLSGNTSAGTITIGAGFETVNVSAAGTNTVAGLVTGAKTVNITGAGDLAITAAIADATKIDGSAATGKLDVETAVNEVTVSTGSGADKIELSHEASVALEATVNAGAGNDKVTITSLDGVADLVDNKVTIDGGAGTDTLVMTSALADALGDLTTAAAYAKKGIANFEKLTISTEVASSADIDVERLGLNSDITLEAGVDTSATLSNVAKGATVTFAAANAGVLTVSVKDAAVAGSTADVLNLVLAAEQTADTGYGIVAAASVETININSTTGNDALTSFTNTLELTATSADTINISGDMKFALAITTNTANVNTNFVGLDTINASSNTAGVTIDMTASTAYTTAVTITGTAKVDTITGGDGADEINAGAGNDTVNSSVGADVMTLGAGNDIFDFNDLAHSGVTIATADRITDWSVGSNVLNVAGAGTFTVVAQSVVQAAITASGQTTFAGILTHLNTANVIDAGKIGSFQFDGDTYVFANTDPDGSTDSVAAADDFVIRLDGLHTLTADNFVL